MNTKNSEIKELHCLQPQQDATGPFMDINESMELLQTVFNASPNSITIFEILWNNTGKPEDFKVLMVNKFGAEMAQRTDLVGQRYADAFPEVRNNGILEAFIKVAETGEPVDFEQRYDGEGLHHWFRLLAHKAGNRLVVTAENITERKDNEQKIAEEQRRFKEAQRIGAIGSFEWSVGAEHVEWSDELFRICGLEPQSRTITNDFSESLIVAEDLPAVIAQKQLSLTSPGQYEIQHRIKLNDGSIKWVAHRFKSFTNPKGQVVRIRGTLQDITEKKHAEQVNLQMKEQLAANATGKYDSLFQSIDQGFCTIALKYDNNNKAVDYRFIEVSPSFEQQTGIKDGVGKWMSEISADQDEFWYEIYGRVAMNRKAERFESYSTPLQRWWNVYAFPIGAPEQRQIGVLFNDITEQIITKKKIKQNEIQYRNVLLQSPNIFVILESFPEMIISFANEPLFKSWGKTAEIIGKPLMEVLPEIKDQPFPKLMQRVFETGETYNSAEEKAVITKNGVAVDTYYKYVYQAIFGDNNKVTGVTIMATDITEQVTARRKIEESEKRYSNLLLESPFAVAILKGHDMVVTLANDAIKILWGKGNNVEGKSLLSLMPEIKEQGFTTLLEQVYTTGVPFYGHEVLVNLQRNGIWEDTYFNFVYQPYREVDETISGVTILANEVTTQAIANKKIAASEQNVSRLFMQAPAIIAVLRGPQHVFELSNKVHREFIGNRDLLGKTVKEAFPELEGTGIYEIFDRVYSTGEPFIGNEIPMNIDIGGGKLEEFFFNFVYQPSQDADGKTDGVMVHGLDVTEQVFLRKSIEESKEQQAFLLIFSDKLRTETTTDAVANIALQMLYNYLKIDRCYVGIYELAEDRGVFPYQIGNELVPPMPTSVRLSEFPDALRVAFERTLVIDDLTKAEGLADTDRQNLGALGLHALVAATVRRGKSNPLWSIVCVSASPRHWTLSEVNLIEEVTERTWVAVERAKAEESLRKSEEKYRTLFNSMDEGFCTLRILYNEAGKPYDCLYLDVNPAFVYQSGLENVVGKTMLEVNPQTEEFWPETYGRISISGEAERSEHAVIGLGKFFEYFAFRFGDPCENVVAVIFNNITNRKNEEERQSYIINLGDALKQLTDPIEIQLTACRILGEHLKLSRVLYAEVINEEQVVMNNNYVNGVPPIIATLDVRNFGKNLIDAFKRNEKVIFSDINTDSGYTEDEKQNFLLLNVVANVSIGLLKGGRWVATFGMHYNAPRIWTATEISLMEETAERTWAAVERAKAEQALRISEEKYRTLFNSIDEGVTIVEVIVDDNKKVIDFTFIEHNPAFTRLTGLPDNVAGRRWLEFKPSVDAVTVSIYEHVLATGKSIRHEYPSDLGKYFNAYFSPTGKQGSNRIVCVFNDVTDRKNRENNLAFLAEMNLDFAPLLTVQQVTNHVGVQLADFLQLSRCLFSIVNNDEDRIEVVYEYKRDDSLPSLLRVHRITDILTEEGRLHYNAGNVTVMNSPEEAKFVKSAEIMLPEIGMRAVVDVPFMENGKWKFLLTIGRAEAKDWRQDEVDLLKLIASKIYIRIKRAMAEEALRKSENKLKLLTENLEKKVERRTAELNKTAAELESNLAILQQAEKLAQIGSWEYDYATESLTWSEGMYILFGLPGHLDVDPDVYVKFAAPNETEHARETVQSIQGGLLPLPDTVCIKTPSGIKVVKLEAVIVYDTEGNRLKMIGVDMDITAERAAAKKMEEQAHFIQSTNDALPDILFVMNLDTKETVYINHSFEETLGYPEVTESSPEKNIVSLIYEEDVPVMIKHLEDLKNSTDGEVFEIEYRIKAAGGGFRWFSDRNTVFKRDSAGIPIEKIGIAQDITERKNTEKELKESNISLRYANENLQQFASIAAHDLQEPLRKIQLFTSVIKAQWTELLPAEGQLVLQKINKASARMSQLIKEVLEYSKIAYEGKEFVKTDLQQVVQNVLDDLDLLTEETGAQITFNVQLPVIEANPLQIHQLFSNIITNAIKYREKERTLEIRISATSLTPHELLKYPQLVQNGNYIQISISDNGIGFEQVYAEQIFHLFERLHNDDQFEGTGVGLALCKKIIETHNGYIFAISEEGVGTEFQIILPIKQL